MSLVIYFWISPIMVVWLMTVVYYDGIAFWWCYVVGVLVQCSPVVSVHTETLSDNVRVHWSTIIRITYRYADGMLALSDKSLLLKKN